MEYNIDIDIWDHKKSLWVPYEANDVLLEYVMMDPYIRMFLTKDSDKTSSRYYAQFQVNYIIVSLCNYSHSSYLKNMGFSNLRQFIGSQDTHF